MWFLACNLQISPSCRYDSGTGEFTVPSGGAGLYYFFIHIQCDRGEQVTVTIRQNEAIFCNAYAGIRDENAGSEVHNSSCGGVVGLEEGMENQQLGIIAIVVFVINGRRHLSRPKITSRPPLGLNSFILMQLVAKKLQNNRLPPGILDPPLQVLIEVNWIVLLAEI